jgi:hypothetical protein
MNNIGFCVFGRPTKHEFKSNGLFAELKLGDGTYIEFSGNAELNKNDSLCMISRSVVSDKEIIKIYCYEYAVSHNKRDGGFVGAGVVFSNEKPTEKLLFKCFFNLQKQALNQINENRQFIEPRLNQDSIQLVNPDTEGLLTGQPIKRKIESISKGSSYGVKIEGNILHSLHGIVQGFISNPDFNKVERLYVTKNTKLLKALVGEKKILSFQRLLSFRTLFDDANKKLKEKKQEFEAIKLEERSLQNEIKNLDNDIDNKNRELKNLEKFIREVNSNKVKVHQELKAYEEKLKATQESVEQNEKVIASQSEQSRKSLEEKKLRLKRLEVARFDELLRHPELKEGIRKFENEKNAKIGRLKNKVESLKYELEKEQNKSFFNKETVIFLGIITTLILGIGFFVGYLFFDSDKQKTVKNVNQNEPINITKKLDQSADAPENLPEVELNLPEEYQIGEFITLGKTKIDKHKQAIDLAINKIESNRYDTSAISKFLKRKWHFAEIIDYNKDSINNGLLRYYKIKSIYKNTYKIKNGPFIKNEYMLNINKEFKDTIMECTSAKRQEIFKTYYSIPGNIYKEMGIDINDEIESFKDYDSFEREYPELYMHFRYMISEISDYKGNKKDLNHTVETDHKVLLIK